MSPTCRHSRLKVTSKTEQLAEGYADKRSLRTDRFVRKRTPIEQTRERKMANKQRIRLPGEHKIHFNRKDVGVVGSFIKKEDILIFFKTN